VWLHTATCKIAMIPPVGCHPLLGSFVQNISYMSLRHFNCVSEMNIALRSFWYCFNERPQSFFDRFRRREDLCNIRI